MSTPTSFSENEVDLAAAAQLLGLPADEPMDWASQNSPAEIDALRQRMLARRRCYCVDKSELIATPQPGRVGKLKRRTMVASVLGFGGVLLGSSWWSRANAKEVNRHRTYAMRLLRGSQAIFCEDSELLNAQMSEAEKRLPEEPMWVLKQSNWQSLYAVNRATQSLSCVRIGQLDLALITLETSRQMLADISESNVQPEIQLLSELTLAKAIFDLLQGLGSQGLNERWEFSLLSPVAESAFRKTRRELEAIESESLEWKLLLVAVELDHARLWIKTQLKAGEHVVANNALNLLNASLGRLQEVPADERDSLWWTLRLRLAGNRLLYEQRIATFVKLAGKNTEGIAVPDCLTRSELDELKQFFEQLSEDDLYRQSLAFEYAIYFSNCADFLWTCRPNEPEAELQYRRETIRLLRTIPTQSRTLRYSENLALNFGSRIYANLRKFHGRELSLRELGELDSDASVLDSQIGGLPAGAMGQVTIRDRIIASKLIGISDEKINAYSRRVGYQPETELEIEILRSLDRQLKERDRLQPEGDSQSAVEA